MHFVSNLEKCREYAFLREYVQIITILHGGGPPNLLQHYIGGGVYWGPIFVLRNKGLGKTSAQINQTSPVTTTRAGSKLK